MIVTIFTLMVNVQVTEIKQNTIILQTNGQTAINILEQPQDYTCKCKCYMLHKSTFEPT